MTLTLSLLGPALGATTPEVGASIRYAAEAQHYDDGGGPVTGGESPPIGLDAGVAFQGASHVGLRLGAAVEGWHARWTLAPSGETWDEGFGARFEGRAALRMVVGSPDRLTGREEGLVGTVDLGAGVAWLEASGWPVPGSRWWSAPTVSLRPAVHVPIGPVPTWFAVDLRAGLMSQYRVPSCVAVPCPSSHVAPGASGVALVVGADLR